MTDTTKPRQCCVALATLATVHLSAFSKYSNWMVRFFVKNLFFITAIMTAIAGCASPGSHNLRKVDVGMEKAAVLEQLGNPVRTGRHQGQDRWTYLAPDNSETFIYFSEGKVTHIGSPNEAPAKFTPVQNPPEKFKPVGN